MRNPNRKRNHQIVFRTTDGEYSAIAKAAKLAGMTLSGYILFKLGMDTGEKIADVFLDAVYDSDASSYDLAVSPLEAQDPR